MMSLIYADSMDESLADLSAAVGVMRREGSKAATREAVH